jgi:hypothetical protein
MHTYDLGDIVIVFNQTMGGKFIIEGTAAIVDFVSDVDEQYYVRFRHTDDQRVVQRFVDPAGQNDPEAFVRRLNGAMLTAATQV